MGEKFVRPFFASITAAITVLLLKVRNEVAGNVQCKEGCLIRDGGEAVLGEGGDDAEGCVVPSGV